jgi:hypothetical protein
VGGGWGCREAQGRGVKNGVQAKQRLCVRSTDAVQGVGFRPFLYELTPRHGITGRVRKIASDAASRII